MQTSPASEIYGLQAVSMFVSPTYCATLSIVLSAPGGDRSPYLYNLTFFRRNPGVEESDQCLDVYCGSTRGDSTPVLTVYDEAGQLVSEDTSADWSDINIFQQRALEIASARFATEFAHFDRSWRYRSVSTADPSALAEAEAQGWSKMNASHLPDGSEWVLMRRSKAAMQPLPVA